MGPISVIRLVGLVLGLYIVSAAFLGFRSRRLNRMETLFRGLVGCALVVVSLFPDTVNFLRDLFSLESHILGRMFALLLVSSLFIWILFFRERGKLFSLTGNFDRFVRSTLARDALRDGLADRFAGVRILAVLPAFNEADNIASVLRRIPSSIDGRSVDAVVIDDGSDDGTARVVREVGYAVVSSPMRRGQGAALRLGYELARLIEAEVVVTLDADGQHQPEEIERVVRPILDGSKDFVLGSRLLGDRQPDSRLRLMGIYFNNYIINFLAGVRISDCSSGFKAVRVECLGRVDLAEDQFQAAEAIISATRHGLRIGEAPITIKRRSSGQSKKGRNLGYALNFTRTVFKAWWR